MSTPPGKTDAQTLNEHAKKWLEKLPPEIQPKELVEKYPRLLNRISSLWRHPEELMEYLNELLVDTRGDRSGFPMSIATELVNIKDYYEMNVHPESKAYLWDPRIRDGDR
jgi:uncharacterized protein